MSYTTYCIIRGAILGVLLGIMTSNVSWLGSFVALGSTNALLIFLDYKSGFLKL